MSQSICPVCQKRLARAPVLFFGDALVHAACWSELRKPPGKARMDGPHGSAPETKQSA
jgi:hypothetical protein